MLKEIIWIESQRCQSTKDNRNKQIIWGEENAVLQLLKLKQNKTNFDWKIKQKKYLEN